jgi:hypothetical protein
MRTAVVIALCAAGWLCAGCFSDRGAAIEVDVGDTGATSVELYIGKVPCDRSNTAGISCTTIAPPPEGRTALRGDIWFRDRPEPLSAKVKGKTATFELKASSATTLPIIIAVGTTATDQGGVRGVGTATLTDLAIPVNSARVVTTTLVRASLVVPGDSPGANATEDRVMVWAKQNPPSSCVVVEHWAHGQATRAFVVPATDPDCDDVAPECNPAAFHGTSAVGGSDGTPECFAPATAVAGACVLGSLGCVDGGPRTGSCVPQHKQICVPSQFCGCDLIGSCTAGKLDGAPEIPRVTCSVPVAADLTVCPDLSAEIDLGVHYPTGDCGQQPLLGSLQAASFGNNLAFDGAELEIASVSAPCTIAIKTRGGTVPLLPADDHGVIKLDTSAGALLLPLVLQFRTGVCGVATLACTPQGDDMNALWSCAP